LAAGLPTRGEDEGVINQLVALILDESKWLTAAMGFALLVVAILLCRYRHSDFPA